MSDWKKVESTVEQSNNTIKSDTPSVTNLESNIPRRPRKRRSDAGIKRTPTPQTNPQSSESKDIEDVSCTSTPIQPKTTVVQSETDDNRIANDNTSPMRSPMRYTKSGRRKGRYRFAAPLGLLVLVLAAIGAISLITSGIHAIEKTQDDTALRTELNEFLSPVIQYNPTEFTDVNETKQDSLLLAAIWRVTDQERIRQLRENTNVSIYALDDVSRMMIPVDKIEQSYQVLFGPKAKLYHHTIGDEGKSFTIEYDEAQNCYHIPSFSSSSMYVSVMDTLKKKGDTIIVRIGYVLSTNIGRNEKGEPIKPTPDMAEYFQLYTVKRSGKNGWMLLSVKDEKSSKSKTSTTISTVLDESDNFSNTTDTNTTSTNPTN